MISERMKNDIKNKDNCLKQAYVPASVKVIELTTQRGYLLSASKVTSPFGGDEEVW